MEKKLMTSSCGREKAKYDEGRKNKAFAWYCSHLRISLFFC